MASTVVSMDTARAKARPSVTPSFARGLALAFPISVLFWAAFVALVFILAF